jgi:hypothetical protein
MHLELLHFRGPSVLGAFRLGNSKLRVVAGGGDESGEEFESGVSELFVAKRIYRIGDGGFEGLV